MENDLGKDGARRRPVRSVDARGRRRALTTAAAVTAGVALLAGCTRPGGGGGGGTGTGSGRYRSATFSSYDTATNLTYGQAKGKTGMTETLRLDLYQPRGDTAAKRPVIVFAHGGAFMFGSKGSLDPATEMARYYVQRGYVTADINYRHLVPTGSVCTGTVKGAGCRDAAIGASFDGMAAVRWLRANAAKYRIDPDRIAFGGDSAGGVMATTVGTLGEIPLDQQPAKIANMSNPGYSSKIQAYMSISGGVDEKTYIDAGDAPGIFFHGTADPIVPYSFSTMTVNWLKAVGVDAKLVTYPGAGHVPWGQKADIEANTTDWFYTHLNLASAAS